MKKKEATPGTMVGIVPTNGYVSNMATRAAFGKINEYKKHERNKSSNSNCYCSWFNDTFKF